MIAESAPRALKRASGDLPSPDLSGCLPVDAALATSPAKVGSTDAPGRGVSGPETPAEGVPPCVSVLASFDGPGMAERTRVTVPLEVAERVLAILVGAAVEAPAPGVDGASPAAPAVRRRGRPAALRYGVVAMSTPAGRQTFTYESFRDLGELLGVHSSNLAAAYARACDRNGLDPARHGGLNWTYGAADILTEVRA